MLGEAPRSSSFESFERIFETKSGIPAARKRITWSIPTVKVQLNRNNSLFAFDINPQMWIILKAVIGPVNHLEYYWQSETYLLSGTISLKSIDRSNYFKPS